MPEEYTQAPSSSTSMRSELKAIASRCHVRGGVVYRSAQHLAP
jgi:hypothetical protein